MVSNVGALKIMLMWVRVFCFNSLQWKSFPFPISVCSFRRVSEVSRRAFANVRVGSREFKVWRYLVCRFSLFIFIVRIFFVAINALDISRWCDVKWSLSAVHPGKVIRANRALHRITEIINADANHCPVWCCCEFSHLCNWRFAVHGRPTAQMTFDF